MWAGSWPMIHMTRNTETIADKKDDTIRKIIRTSAMAAQWLPLPEEFHSGDEMGFDIGEVKVRAIVEFDKYGVAVRMTHPVKTMAYKEVYYRQQTFFRRNKPGSSLFVDGIEGGSATEKCLDTARDLLTGLYSDWMILQSRKEAIRRKLTCFSDFARAFMEKEAVRISSLKSLILELSRQSGELKRRFKNGEMPQEEYVEKRKPIHNEIVSLMKASHPRDPFQYRFSAELNECRYAIDRETLVKSF